MKADTGDIAIRWRRAWKTDRFRTELIGAVFALLIIGIGIPYFFGYIQTRSGIGIHDPLLKQLPAYNVAVFIFGLIYTAIFFTLIYLIQHPVILLRTLQAYAILSVLRICSIFLVPLEPPLSIIPLTDPFVDMLFYNDLVITKDLFFSGHVSMLFLLFLVTHHSVLKVFVLMAACIVAVLLMIQHAHYTVDIVGGFLFSWISFKIVFSLYAASFGRQIQDSTLQA